MIAYEIQLQFVIQDKLSMKQNPVWDKIQENKKNPTKFCFQQKKIFFQGSFFFFFDKIFLWEKIFVRKNICVG